MDFGQKLFRFCFVYGQQVLVEQVVEFVVSHLNFFWYRILSQGLFPRNQRMVHP